MKWQQKKSVANIIKLIKNMPKEININTRLIKFDSLIELNENEQVLVNAAKKSALNAYAPYSEFQVGCAILLNDGQIVTGNNQENAAYPSSLCAERVALFYAKSQKPESVVLAIAIYASSKSKTSNNLISPCGACRQVISEYESKQAQPIKLYMCNNDSVYFSESNANLLPFQFDSSHLIPIVMPI